MTDGRSSDVWVSAAAAARRFQNRLWAESILWKLLQDLQSHCVYHFLVSKLPLLQGKGMGDFIEESFKFRDQRITFGHGRPSLFILRGNGYLASFWFWLIMPEV